MVLLNTSEPFDPALYAAAPRVFHLILGQEHGGVEAFFVKLAAALQRRGVPQRAVIQKGRPWAKDARVGGVPVTEIAFGGFRELPARKQLTKEIGSFGPDVVLAWMSRAARRVPRGDFVSVVRLPGFIGTHGLGRIDHAVVTTPVVADFVASTGFPRDRIHVIPNFGGLPRGEPIPRNDYRTPDGAPLLIALGRLIEKKGFDVLLCALAKLPEGYLWLAGSGALADSLRAQAERLGVADRVRFLGWFDKQERLFAAADICVIPSRSEPFGNVVVEAWAAGCPLVATRSEGPGLIATDGVDALLVPVDDADALASAIGKLIQDPSLRLMLAENGQRTHQERYSEEAICSRYVSLFREIVARRRL
jgi:glycosyltransferase involved in cell wall biosynthesis